MKSFSFALSIFLVIGTSQAMPQYGQVPAAQTGGGVQAPKTPSNPQPQINLPEGCSLKWKDFNSVVYVETEEEVCTPYTDRVCVDKYKRVCTPYEDTVYVTKYKEECEVKYNEVCNDKFRDIVVPYTEDDCTEVQTKVCESHWVILDNGDKVWEEDPKTCKNAPVTKCVPVQKTKTRSEKYRDCNQVPYDDCIDVPYQEATKVTKETCEQVRYDDCKDVTKNNCVDVHKKVPQTQTERRQVRQCDGLEDVIIKSDDEINQIIKDGTRSGLDDVNEDDDVEVFTFSK